MITKINSTEPSFKSTVIMTPRTVGKFREGLNTTLRKDLLAQLEKLEKNGNNDTVYITCHDWATHLEMEIAESINGVTHTALASKMRTYEIVSASKNKFEVADLVKMYEALRTILLPVRKNDMLARFIKV